MAKVNILNYELFSSSGNLQETLDTIKNDTTKIFFKEVQTLQGYVEIPYFSFQDEVKQNQRNIYLKIKTLLSILIATIDHDKRERTALIIGTSLVDWYLVDAINDTVYAEEKKPYTSEKHSIDSYAKMLSIEFGLNEFTMTINTACTSSANALLEASNLINMGIFEYAIVIGVEIFSPIMSSGFYAMDLIASVKPKPFDTYRDGLVLGEAIAGVVLGKDESIWSLEGGFSNCDSQTITSVSESGKECIDVMHKALQECGLDAVDITAVKTHATGSHSNDIAEINAISAVFESKICFTALKPYLGHTIGASGVSEIVLFIAALNEGFIPKTLDCEVPILAELVPLKEHKACKSGLFMCNYFGFGGNNISLIIKKESV